MFPLMFFFQCAQKSIVFESNIFKPCVWLSFTDVTQDSNEISLMWHLPNVARPTSTLQTKVQSPATWFPSNVHHALYDVKNHCAAVGNCRASFFFHVCSQAAKREHCSPLSQIHLSLVQNDTQSHTVMYTQVSHWAYWKSLDFVSCGY